MRPTPIVVPFVSSDRDPSSAPEGVSLECYIRSLGDAEDDAARELVLRQACETLAAAPATVHAIGVTGSLTMSRGAANPLLALSEQLAAEYGMRSLLHVGHRSFTVHFTRHDPSPGWVRRT